MFMPSTFMRRRFARPLPVFAQVLLAQAIVLVLAFLFAAIPLVARQAPGAIPPRPLELQGDSLGEPLAVFMGNHPKALCQDVSKTRRDCYQWENVSIYGLSPRPDSDCTPARHARPGCEQGLTAQFYEGHLFMISYAVSGKDKGPAVVFLKKKFSAPISDTPDGTVWAVGNRTLSVVVEKSGGRGDVESIVRFTLKGIEVAAPPRP
jgi:hypothetical protein